MCGIIGAFGPSVPSLKNQWEVAIDSLIHRGPDGRGFWLSDDKLCFVGHQRLAILDASTLASQPMMDDKAVLAYNGEIYNHLALRKGYLSGETSNFKTHSDTETLFHLLKNYSREKVLKSLDGMFAGAFYEQETKGLLLFRDSLGIKPLYWTIMEDGTVLFSSEIKGILSLFPSYPRYIDREVLETYTTFENWPQGKCLFSGIHLLLPGENLLLRTDKNKNVSVEKEKWTSPEEKVKKDIKLLQKSSLPKDYDGWIQYVRDAVEESVKAHLLSDVPLSAYLSGGLDSGSIVAVAAQHHKNILTFTGYYDVKDSWYDERTLARKTADYYQLQQIEVPIIPEDFVSSFDELIRIIEEPRMGMGSFSQLIVAKKAAQYRRVILAGHGGDESFFGYPFFKACKILNQFPRFSSLKALTSLHRKEWPWLLNLLLERLKGKIYVAPRLWADFPFEYFSNKNSGKNIDGFLVPNFSKILDTLETYYEDIYLPGLLLLEDKISMAFSLETRTPLWSPHFLAKIHHIPSEIKLSRGRLKGLFKDAVSCWLPPEVINAPKRGFPTPFRYWFRNELREEVNTRLLTEGDALDGLISKEQRKKILKSYFNTKLPSALDERRAHKIWMLLCLESWARQFNTKW